MKKFTECQSPDCPRTTAFIQNKRGTRKYCSDACKQASYRASQLPPMLDAIAKSEKRVICPSCEKPFTPGTKKAKYCSERCRVSAWRKTHKKHVARCTCEQCKELYTPTQGGYNVGKYCSDACKQKAYRATTGRDTAEARGSAGNWRARLPIPRKWTEEQAALWLACPVTSSINALLDAKDRADAECGDDMFLRAMCSKALDAAVRYSKQYSRSER